MPTNPFNNCIQFSDNRTNATFRDKKGKTKYVFPNNTRNEISGLRIDNCLLTDDKKCDYLLLNHNENKAWATFIELKGADLIQAVRQIDNAVNQLSSQLPNFKLHGRIVLTKTYAPNIQSSEYKKLKEKFRKIGGTFESNSMTMIEKTLD